MSGTKKCYEMEIGSRIDNPNHMMMAVIESIEETGGRLIGISIEDVQKSADDEGFRWNYRIHICAWEPEGKDDGDE